MNDRKSIPKYVLVKNIIKERIHRGEIQHKLPGERVLSRELDISYMTIRKAVEELVDEGVLFKLPTRGTFVNKNGVTHKKTHNIGFFLPDDFAGGISNPSSASLLRDLERGMKQQGYNLVYFSDLEDLNPLKNRKKIDGLVASFKPQYEAEILEVSSLIPTVLIGNGIAGAAIPFVGIDNSGAMEQAVRYLVSLGHRRIAYAGSSPECDATRDRLSAFSAAMTAFGLQVPREYIYSGDCSYSFGRKAVNAILACETAPTALVCGTDLLAMGAIRELWTRGLRVPEDMSVIGFDDNDVAAHSAPSLTSLRIPRNELAEISLTVLLSLVNGREVEERQIILPVELVERESCRKMP